MSIDDAAINEASVVAELRAAFEAYERALMAWDADALDSFFWQDPRVLRYGIAENLYGPEAIATFRRSRTTVAARTLHNTTIMTYGAHYGTANTEFLHIGDPRIGRQTQTWVRMADGWRIVAAHVSWLAERE